MYFAIRHIYGKHDVGMYFLLKCAFLFGGGDVGIFFLDGILIVLNLILQYLVSLRNLELLN